MSAVLGFDTSTSRLTVAVLGDDGERFDADAAADDAGRPRHARELMRAIERAVAAAGGWPAIDLIAAGVGPGTFTGLRIGVATANALGAAQELPLAGVSSLAALARGAEPREHVLAIADAKRREVFAARFGPDGEPEWGPWVGAPAELGEQLAGEARSTPAVGEGAVRFRHELEALGAVVPGDADPAHALRGASVCELGRDMGGSGEPLQPVYLRRPDAELWRERDRKPDTNG